MGLIDMGDGLIVESETGEVIEAPEGVGDMVAYMAHKGFRAKQQAKRWSDIEGAAKAALLNLQADKTARYGDIVAQKRQSSRPVFDSDRFGAWIEEQRLPDEELEALVLAAKGFDVKRLSVEYLAERIAACTDKVPTREFIVLDVVAELAPGTEAK